MASLKSHEHAMKGGLNRVRVVRWPGTSGIRLCSHFRSRPPSLTAR